MTEPKEEQIDDDNSRKRGSTVYGGGEFGLHSLKLITLLDGFQNNGCRNAILIDFLVSRYLYDLEKGKLDLNGYKYMSFSYVTKNFPMSRSVQQRIFLFFQELELIDVYIDKPSGNRRLIKVNVDKIKRICAMPIEEIQTVRMEPDEVRKKRQQDYLEEKIGVETN